jgi:hypothetical protein
MFFNNDFFNKLNQTQRMVKDMTRLFTQPILEQRKIFSSIINPYITDITKSFKRLADGIRETEEDIKTFKATIVELGYPPHESIDIKRLRYIARDYRDNGKEHVEKYIDEFMVSFYDSQMLSNISLEWENIAHVKKRLPLLRNSIMAYNQGMYDLVVPSLLSQFEGIIVDGFKVDGYVNGVIISILLDYLLLKNQEFDSSISFDDAIHKYYSDKILAGFKHGSSIKSDVSRNAILHGADTNFGKQTVALKVILLMDYIIGSVNNLKEETIDLAKEEIKKYKQNKRYKSRNKRKLTKSHVRRKRC